MESRHNTVRDGRENQVTVRVYADGDIVVTNGGEGGCISLADVSGYDPLLDLCDGIGLDDEVEEDVLDFVDDNTGLFA